MFESVWGAESVCLGVCKRLRVFGRVYAAESVCLGECGRARGSVRECVAVGEGALERV